MRVGSFGSRNFGCGKNMGYAGHNALRESYSSQFETIQSHSDRFGRFVAFCKDNGIRDLRDVSREVVQSYGHQLADRVAEQELSVSYAQNLLSSVNVTMEALREDRTCAVSPSDLVGERSSVRTVAPELSREALDRALDDLRDRGHDRAAVLLELAREFGLRGREAALLNPSHALEQAREQGRIRITEGTKGGAGKSTEIDRERWVPVSPDLGDRFGRQVQALEHAQELQVGNNLVPNHQTLEQFTNHVRNVALPALKNEGIEKIHELRSAYACERYQELTASPAPVVAGQRLADKPSDWAARDIITRELGHGRRDVVASYVGSSK